MNLKKNFQNNIMFVKNLLLLHFQKKTNIKMCRILSILLWNGICKMSLKITFNNIIFGKTPNNVRFFSFYESVPKYASLVRRFTLNLITSRFKCQF